MIIYLLSFLLSFCSISYQFIIARVLGQFSNDDVLSQSITLGFYLVAMGFGSQAVGFLKTKKEPGVLLTVEIILSALGLILVPLLYLSYVTIYVFFSDYFTWIDYLSRGADKVFLFQGITFVIGFLTGMELPLLLKIQERKSGGSAFNKVLGVNYLGALAGSFLVALYILPRLDLIRGSVLIALVNFLSALLLILYTQIGSKRLIAIGITCTAFFLTCFATLKTAESVQQIYIKSFYLETKMQEFSATSVKNFIGVMNSFTDIERFVTPYQIIDIIPDDFTHISQVPGDFSLYLNMQPQFSRSTYRAYHESMVSGALNLAANDVKNVLVLGAGDGLLVAELLKYKNIEKITLVELDPFMIQLAQEYKDIKDLNEASLFDPRVEIVVGDAFSFIRRSKNTYDGVFVDFPFPVSYDLGKLFSVEFYSSLRQVISEDGFFVADMPVWQKNVPREPNSGPAPQDVILSSISAAGFSNYLLYGPFESYVFVSRTNQEIRFNYETLPDRLSNQTIINLNPLTSVQENTQIHSENVNSIFKPKRFKW